MSVLAWDTATAATVVAFGEVELRHDPPPGERPGHTRELLPLAARALAEAGAEWEDIARLVAGVGPGSFTGLRIGLATARALAQGRGIPLVGVSSLRAVAAGAGAGEGEGDPEVVLAVLDARRGEAFAAAWAGSRPLLEPAALGPEALTAAVAALPGAPPLALGDGALRYRAALAAAGARVPAEDDPRHRLSARALARLGAELPPGPLTAVLPEYIRPPDAVPTARRGTA